MFWDRGYIYTGLCDPWPTLYISHYLPDTIIPPDSNHYVDWVRTVYPEPGLQFSLSEGAYVSLLLFNTAGAVAHAIDLGYLGAGPHQVALPELRAGVYFLFMKTNEEDLNKKIVFTRP